MRLARAVALRGHQGPVHCLASCPSTPTALATGSADKTARVWDVRASRCERGIRGFDNAVNSVAWGQQGAVLYVAEANRVHMFDLRRPDLILSTSDGTFMHNQEEINQIAVGESGEWLAVCDDAGEIQILDLRNNTLARTLRGGHDNICSCVAVRPRYPTEVISGGFDCNIDFWDINTGRPKHQVDTGSLQGGAGPMINPPFVNCLSVSYDGHYIAAGLGNCTIACFSEQVTGGRGKKGPARKRKELVQTHVLYNGHMGGVSSVSFLPPRPAPQDVFSDSLDALTLSMSSSMRHSSPSPSPAPEVDAAMQAGNRLLVSGGNDRNLCVWDLVAAGEAIVAMETLDPLAAPGLVAKVEHGQKINWVLASWLDHADAFIAVADPTSVVQLYSMLQ